MCGIVGYIGNQEASPIIYAGLQRLEYRGYDSAGIATLDQGQIDVRRAEGKLVNLDGLLRQQPLVGTLGIGHTRWATHGKPSEINAHPHRAGNVVVVHNGIIENYLQLREQLKAKGHTFSSETDTEIVAHLIESYDKEGCGFETAVRNALKQVRGAYAVAVINRNEPEKLIAAKLGSPLVVGQGEGEYFVASDIPAMLSHTREMIFLEDGEMVVFSREQMSVSTLDGEPLDKQPKTITWSPLMAEKGGYKHFMLKEIHEQPRAIADTIAGRVQENESSIYLEDLQIEADQLAKFDKVFLVACGTSWHAALVGKYMIEQHCRVPVEVDIASEFRYRNPIITDKTLTIVVSQSGETADTLAALREARGKGGKVVCICNVVESSIARESDGIIYTHAGPEIGVASTKAFTTQLVALRLLVLALARRRGMSPEREKELVDELHALPRQVEVVLKLSDDIKQMAQAFGDKHNALFLGRGTFYPVALEGALKLKEISYIHAEAYPAGELKHGPLALVDASMPVVCALPDDPLLEKVLSNLQEVRARGGELFLFSDQNISIDLDNYQNLTLSDICPTTAPIVYSIPLQLLAYHVAVLKGTDVDQPRNLAKSVTVE